MCSDKAMTGWVSVSRQGSIQGGSSSRGSKVTQSINQGASLPGDIKDWIREELFEQVPVAISVIDRDFRIIEANFAFAEQYGDWNHRLCYEVYKGRQSRCTHCGAAATFADGTIRTREERGRDLSGEPTFYLVQIVPMIRPDGSIPYVIEMSTDVTRIKELEREKLEAERLAAVGQTVAGLAHGVKNIIMGLEGGMYVVNSGLRNDDPERMAKGWRMLETDISRISSFVKEFLDFARGRTPTVKMVDPNSVASEVLGLFRARARSEGVELIEDFQQDIEPAPMDREGIHTCLTNLVLNAIDACIVSNADEDRVVVTTRESDGKIIFEVTDNGCGMDADVKRRVFTNFFSTKASGKGTGLGLLTTRKIVQEHGGKVDVESEEGEGATFRLIFSRDRLPPVSEETDKS